MNNMQNQKGHEIKKNPSRDSEKDSQKGSTNLGSDTAGRNEVNPGKIGNQSEVDLNRSGVAGSKGSTGINSPRSSQTQKQQQQSVKGVKQGLNQFRKQDLSSVKNTDDEDLASDEVSMSGSDEDEDVDSGVDSGVTSGQKNLRRNNLNSDSANI